MIFFMCLVMVVMSAVPMFTGLDKADAANEITIYFDSSYTGHNGSSHGWTTTMDNVYYYAYGTGGNTGNSPLTAMKNTGEDGSSGGKLFSVKLDVSKYQHIILCSQNQFQTGSDKDQEWQTNAGDISSSSDKYIFGLTTGGINDPNDNYYKRQRIQYVATYEEKEDNKGNKWALANYTSSAVNLRLEYETSSGYKDSVNVDNLSAGELGYNVTVPDSSLYGRDEPYTKVTIYRVDSVSSKQELKTYTFADGKIPGDQTVNGNVFIYGVTEYATDKLDKEKDKRNLCYWHARCDSTQANERVLYFSKANFSSSDASNITVVTSYETYPVTAVTTDGNASLMTTKPVKANANEVITVNFGADKFHMVWDMPKKNLISKPYDAALISGKYTASSTFDDGDGVRGITVDSEFFDYKYSSTKSIDGSGNTTGSSNTPVVSGTPYGRYKRPYDYINRAISSSQYANAFNDSFDQTLNNDTIKNKPPMYLGGFWSNEENAQNVFNDTNAANEKSQWLNNDGGTASSEGTPTATGSILSKYRYGANLAFRPEYQNPGVSTYYNAVAQGLVDSELTGDPDSGYELKANGELVPYFSESWWSTQSEFTDLSKFMSSAENIAFPFFVMNAGTNAANVNVNNGIMLTPSDYHKVYKGDYYVFDSSKDVARVNLESGKVTRIHNASDDAATYDGYGNSIAGDYTQRGFLPFNEANELVEEENYDNCRDSQRAYINYGFGAKYNFDFYLTETGTLDGQEDGIPITFTFKGDDDVWVFLDNKLILDMGGDHKEATGEINFATKTISISQAGKANTNLIQEKTTGVTVDNVTLTSPTNPSVAPIVNKRFDDTDIGISLDSDYVKSGKHRLTMYYLERGMLNSNLFVMFNLPQDTTLWEVQEDTDFGGINAGFKKSVKLVADTDVFNYTVENRGTDNTGMSSQYNYPTYESNSRVNTTLSVLEQQSTSLSGQGSTPTQTMSTNSITKTYDEKYVDVERIYLDTSRNLGWYWHEYDPDIYAHFFNGSNVKDIKATRVGTSSLYYVDKPSGYTGLVWVRCKAGTSSSNIWNEGYKWNQTVDITLAQGKNRYVLTDASGEKYTGYWDIHIATRPVTQTLSEKVISYPYGSYSTYDFNPANQTDYQPLINNNSQGVTYELSDEFCANKVVLNTRNAGTEYPNVVSLQYGQMAGFRKQFTHNSDMKVTQMNELSTVVNSSNSKNIIAGYTSSDRTVDKYYDTYIKTKDMSALNMSKPLYAGMYDGDDLVGINMGTVEAMYAGKNNYSNTSTVNLQYEGMETTYKFLDPSDSSNKNVHLRQVFINAPKTVALTIKKELAYGDDVTNVNEDFQFKIKFTNVFGKTYGDSQIGSIAYTKYGRETTTTTSMPYDLTNGATFVLKAGEYIMIEGIPVGTKYMISETTESTSLFELNEDESINLAKNEPIEIDGNKTAIVSNSRKTGSLKIEKLVYDAGGELQDNITTEFPIKLKLTADSAVNITNYPLTFKWDNTDLDFSKITTSKTSDQVITLTIMVKPNSVHDGTKLLEVSGIPYGTSYEVSEDSTLMPGGFNMASTEPTNSVHTKTGFNSGAYNYVLYKNNVKSVAPSSSSTDWFVAVENIYVPIVMPETGGTPLIFLLPYGIIAIAVSGVALVIYKKKLQGASLYVKRKGRSD